MENLEHAIVQELIVFLMPFMDKAERNARLFQALGWDVYCLIDFEGSAEIFTINMVKFLLIYGEISPGKSAMLALLDVIHNRVGGDRQSEIDKLRQKLVNHFDTRLNLLDKDSFGTDEKHEHTLELAQTSQSKSSDSTKGSSILLWIGIILFSVMMGLMRINWRTIHLFLNFIGINVDQFQMPDRLINLFDCFAYMIAVIAVLSSFFRANTKDLVNTVINFWSSFLK